AAYSVRPGTVAARWEDDVPLVEKKRRLHAVEELQGEIALELNQQYVGKIEEILIEETNMTHGRQQWKGRNRANKWVFFPQPDEAAASSRSTIQTGDLVKVGIERATAWSLQGCALAV